MGGSPSSFRKRTYHRQCIPYESHRSNVVVAARRPTFVDRHSNLGRKGAFITLTVVIGVTDLLNFGYHTPSELLLLKLSFELFILI